MPIGPEAYRPLEADAELSCGDIAFLTLARTREAGEAPPGDAYDPIGRVPAYPMPATLPLAHGREVAIDTIFGLVVTPLVRDRPAAQPRRRRGPLGLPPDRCAHRAGASGSTGRRCRGGGRRLGCDRGECAGCLALSARRGRSLGDGSRSAGAALAARLRRPARPLDSLPADGSCGRLLGLSPDYLGVLQRQLVRFFVWREVARHEQVEAMVGRRIVSAVPAGSGAGRLAVALTADDGSSITVEIVAR